MEKTRKEVHIIMKIIDFSKCELSNRNLEYAGRAGEKRGIIYNGEMWFLKFPKNTVGMSKVSGLSYVTSPLSEFIGSSIYKLLGYDVHETILGICNDGKRIPITKILDIVNQNNKESIFRVYSRINENMDKIKSLINDIPTEYNGIEIMSNARKEYYLKTIDIRIEQLLKKYL